jgi:activator of 2-hydroxyglutaryl-CoA dehydratase/predicted nucleotide-binding protein (sugar kinase/HSP70/actin superfamily)
MSTGWADVNPGDWCALRDRSGSESPTAASATPTAAIGATENSSAARECGTSVALLIDAGVEHLRLQARDPADEVLCDVVVPSTGDLRRVVEELGLRDRYGSGPDAPVFITGKLAPMAREALGGGKTFLPAAVAWLAARDLIAKPEQAKCNSLAIVELSASGYLVVGVERSGELKEDQLVVNPHCGAGSGINLSRVLEKLAVPREEVDDLLTAYAGESGRERRDKVTVRADRCGVFSTSATISDKNQGIPLEIALATTLKSEVLKACRKLRTRVDKVYLTGRVFRWRFARECAEDHLRTLGVREVACDAENDHALESLRLLVARVGARNLAQPDPRLARRTPPEAYPAFAEIKRRYEAAHRYLRLPDEPLAPAPPAGLSGRPLHLAVDAGSTMAKAVVADAETGQTLFFGSYSNAGDTIETVKQVFRELSASVAPMLDLRSVGVTGSARYQVQQALVHIYPELAQRVFVLVENYAHARGSIELARAHVARLKALGVADVNENLCVLVDIGGEDTKISTVALREAELFNNAMNLKCSAGTGSLMDTLVALFGMPSIADACAEAFASPSAFVINATCAVFLMENARKLQAQGVPRERILAATNWAIVENMARTLWPQVELPRNPVVLLHGQTMLSEPLPLAVTHRLQSYLDGPAFGLVPPRPGHRACIGLIRSASRLAPSGAATIPLARLIDAQFEKRVIQCRGAACSDPAAVCNRTALTCRGPDGCKLVSFTLGGCSAINELLAHRKEAGDAAPVRDAYKEIWDFVDRAHPRTDDPRRLVIPRSFCVSEWAHFLACVLSGLGIPVHVDNVRDTDVLDAQPLFNVDSCAPHIGAVGQFRRLAAAPHGMILAPQVEFLPTDGKSLGRTCAMNQGGVAVAMNLARLAHPDARFHLFNLDLGRLDPEDLGTQLLQRLAPVFRFYGVAPDAAEMTRAIEAAIAAQRELRAATADFAADLAEEALAQGTRVAVVVGREYVLNPGIYDSHVRRLLRDKRMLVLPSYVLDIDLDEAFNHVYWRNPHFILTLLSAVAHRTLHERLRHPRLREVFRTIEAAKALLPVVQVSTFGCGPDTMIAPFISEIMKRRPFLLIQSDAVIKELAHLENRVNTYVKQLDLGLHEKVKLAGGADFEIRRLDDLINREPIDRATDVIYIPTLGDNRVVTTVLRGAGYACIDNYGDDHDLQKIVKLGRRATGDAVCTPMAGMYGDLLRAVEDFARRRAAGDPVMVGKRRLLYMDSAGTGPCRQGQYPDAHRLLFSRSQHSWREGDDAAPCNALPGGGILKLLVAKEAEGYDIGLDEWVLLRCHLGVILQGVLQSVLFEAAIACRSFEEYQRFLADYRGLKSELFRALEGYSGPGPVARAVVRTAGGLPIAGWIVKYFAYALHRSGLMRPLRRFARRWPVGGRHAANALEIGLTGEGYMRVAQAEDIFRSLLASLGFGRFRLELTPAWSYAEYLIDEAIQVSEDRIERAQSAGHAGDRTAVVRTERGKIRQARMLRFAMRQILARPLYAAARVSMPPCTARMLEATREVLQTLRPLDELITYVGEALTALRKGAHVLLNVGPNGCLVATMGEVLTPRILSAEGVKGRIQPLFSAEGDVNEDLLNLVLLKALGPEGYYRK